VAGAVALLGKPTIGADGGHDARHVPRPGGALSPTGGPRARPGSGSMPVRVTDRQSTVRPYRRLTQLSKAGLFCGSVIPPCQPVLSASADGEEHCWVSAREPGIPIRGVRRGSGAMHQFRGQVALLWLRADVYLLL
jgi:hypothetical protein